MIELPDDELDKLFRKSSEELDPHFDPADWDSLKKRLDQQDGKTAGGWLKKWWPLGMLLLLIPAGIASYYWVSSRNEEARKLQQPTVTAAPKTSAENVTEANTEDLNKTADREKITGSEKIAGSEDAASENADFKKTIDLEKENNIKESPAVKVEKPVASIEKPVKVNRIYHDEKLANRINSSSKSLPRSQSKAGGVYLEPNRSKTGGGDGALILSSENKNLISDSRRTVASELGARKVTGPDGVGAEAGNIEGKNLEGVSNVSEQKLLISASMLDGRSLTWKNSIPYPGIVIEPNDQIRAESSAGSKDIEVIESPKWAIRLGYSPDLSTVGFKNFTKPGAAFSLLGEYGISKRLYVQAGVVRSVKDYYANASEYKLNKYVTDINTPYGVDGTCTMFEIPIGVRFDIAQMPHSRWFAGTGFSSYYAQKEKYTYYYKEYKHNQRPGWEGKTGLFLLSHLNASVGYEHTITRKLSILAEPYVRIPLKGVGYGKVNLFTTGAWLSVRYTPAFYR
ncbi:hypothetical protein [Dyadobacter luticola]|uniref:PorT family protein n=1 Tax=Dyadobacter luticola TaxID=1979387 RepID=A0A5R9KVR0_9BACT|nr:hypothetical protein [Dyadobacter luticola]TLV00248.1 hypothetical protein FEN17_12140 [Dyadobacter luticola]